MYKIELGVALKKVIGQVRELHNENELKAIISLLNKMTKEPEAIIEAMPNFDCEEVLLYADNDLTVYYIATPPGILYPPHEHGMVAISALYRGTETHVFYERVGENIKERTRVTATAPAVVDMEIDAVHAICTSDAVPNEGLHFYLGGLETQTRTMWNISGDSPRQYVHDDYLKSARPL